MEACAKLPVPRRPDEADALNAVSRVHRSAAAGRGFGHGLAASAWATSAALRTWRSDEPAHEFDARRLRFLEDELARQADLFREVFGNPFRPILFSPEWRTDTAMTLARTMYEARDFSAMPILADALQDAGCENADLLEHCRDTTQVHVRGCWVVDLVLGKE